MFCSECFIQFNTFNSHSSILRKSQYYPCFQIGTSRCREVNQFAHGPWCVSGAAGREARWLSLGTLPRHHVALAAWIPGRGDGPNGCHLVLLIGSSILDVLINICSCWDRLGESLTQQSFYSSFLENQSLILLGTAMWWTAMGLNKPWHPLPLSQPPLSLRMAGSFSLAKVGV